MVILGVCNALVHIEFLQQEFIQLIIRQRLDFLRLDHAGNIAAHGSFTDGVAPAGLDAVAAFNAINSDRQPQGLGELDDGGLDIYRFTVKGAVSLGSQCN